MSGRNTLVVEAVSAEGTASVRASNKDSSQRMIVNKIGVNSYVHMFPSLKNACARREYCSKAPVFFSQC